MFSYKNGVAEKAEPEYSIGFETVNKKKTIKTIESTTQLDYQGKLITLADSQGNKEEEKQTRKDSAYGLVVEDKASSEKLAELFKTAVKLCLAPSNDQLKVRAATLNNEHSVLKEIPRL